MTMANLYRKLKQILTDSNESLVNKGLNKVNNLNEILSEIKKAGGINRLPYVLRGELLELTEEDIGSATLIVDFAFQSCSNLESVVIPNGVITIGKYAFNQCVNLKNVTIGNSVTTISECAFYQCYNLESVTIPDSVVTINSNAFGNCGLRNIYLNSVTPPSLSSTGTIPNITTIHVPIGSGDSYKSATNWSYYSDRIVEDVEIE